MRGADGDVYSICTILTLLLWVVGLGMDGKVPLSGFHRWNCAGYVMMLVILGYSVGGTLYNVLRTFQFAQENMQKAGADASSVAAVELILIGVFKFMMTLIMTFAKRTGRAAFGDDGMVFVFPLQVHFI